MLAWPLAHCRGTALNKNTVPNAVWAYSGKPSSGASNPRFYHFDDRVVRLVKWHPSAHGVKACYNELVASRLGQLLGAPIVRGGVVYVPNDVIPSDHRAIGAREGFHFGVTKMKGCDFVPAQHYGDISNFGELAAAAVHLGWLRIADQHGHNQWLEETADPNGKPVKLFRLVDLGHTFANGRWTPATLAALPMKYSLPTHILAHVNLATLAPIIATLRGLSQQSIEGCFDDIPDEWNVDTQERQAAINQVLCAREKIEEILKGGNPTLS